MKTVEQVEYKGMSEDDLRMAAMKLLISDRMGIYIPQIWAEEYSAEWDGWSEEDLQILKDGPDGAEYWDTWYLMESNLQHKENAGLGLYQDGDLWLVDWWMIREWEIVNGKEIEL